MAQKHGIYGFCFYHYYFLGKKLLNRPAELILENQDINMNFCFSWANHDWQRTWFGRSKEILLKQEYGEKNDWISHFEYLLPFFKDSRYMKVENKPIFLIYDSLAIGKCKELMECWNALAKKNGFTGVYFIQTLTGGEIDNRKIQFDAVCEFEPFYTTNHRMTKIFYQWKRGKTLLRRLYNKIKKDSEVIELFLNYDLIYKSLLLRRPKGNVRIIPGAFVDWDNSPRKQYDSTVFKNVSPEKFKEYLYRQLIKCKQQYKSEFLFLNAWNEWGEGTYLEPDEQYGYAYLEAVKSAIEKVDGNFLLINATA